MAFGEGADAEVFTHQFARLGGRFAACLPPGAVLRAADGSAVDVSVADASRGVEHAVGGMDEGLGRSR